MQQDGALRCSVGARSTGFDVSWSNTGAESARFVIERRAFGTIHWRGRTPGTTKSFVDGPAPTGSSSLTYWVKALDRKGQVLDRAECSFRTGARCWTSAAEGPGVEVRWDELYSFGELDVVVRRAVRPGQLPWWRAKVVSSFDAGTYYDTPSPTGWAQYQIVVKRNGRVVGVSNCEPSSCHSVSPTAEPTDDQISQRTPEVLGSALSLPPGSGISSSGPGFLGQDGGLWFIGATEGGLHVVRQDQSTGEFFIGPSLDHEAEPNMRATQRRVYVSFSGKGTYGHTSQVNFDEATGEITFSGIGEGTRIIEAADGALTVSGVIHNVSGLQYVPAGGDSGVWIDGPNGDEAISIRNLTFGTDHRLFFTRHGDWYVADMRCYA